MWIACFFAGRLCLQLDWWRCSGLWSDPGRDPVPHESRTDCGSTFHWETGRQRMSRHHRWKTRKGFCRPGIYQIVNIWCFMFQAVRRSVGTPVIVTGLSGRARMTTSLKGVSNICVKPELWYVGSSDLTRSDLCRDEWARLNRQILAIDALHFKRPRDQYHMGRITRELNKVTLSVFNSFSLWKTVGGSLFQFCVPTLCFCNILRYVAVRKWIQDTWLPWIFS